jgi:outer membrane lipoprotein SlyB
MRRFIAVALVFGLVACTYPTSETYRASETGKPFEVEYAVVMASRRVTVVEDTDATKNWYGPIAGATIGGVSAAIGGGAGRHRRRRRRYWPRTRVSDRGGG